MGRSGLLPKIVIEPELLESLYWGNCYTLFQIGNIFGCGASCVKSMMIKYDIPRRRTGYQVTDFIFDDRQKEIFEGCMLGDGGLLWQTNYSYFSNTDVHEEYLVWLQKQLGVEEISSVKPVYREGFDCEYYLVTRVIPSLKDEYKRWYPDGAGTQNDIHRKIIPKDIVLTLTKVLFWYIGDGDYLKRDSCMNFNNYLSWEDAEMLKGKLCILLNVNNGITVNKHGHRDSKGNQIYRLRLNKVVSDKFFKLIDDLDFDIPECYLYKFGW
jgi:hypothetical protein